jgi:hypothetical protein
MAQKLSEQGLIVYKEMLDQLGFLKKQEWVVTNYLMLVYAAIFWLGSNPKVISSIGTCVLMALTIVACVCAVTMLVVIECDLKLARRRVKEADEKIFDHDECDALGIKRYQGPHYRGLLFVGSLIVVAASGAMLLICFLSRQA